MSAAAPRYDAVVVGGGPGGATAGAFLAQAGRRVLILERSRFPRFHIGESLLPASWEIWERLGITDRVNEAGFAVKQGVLFTLQGGHENFFGIEEVRDLFDREYTFHVRRSDYDKLLLDRAREMGAEVREEVRVRDVLTDEDGRVYGVEAVDADGAPLTVHADVVVDATGRDTLVARKLGLRSDDPALRKVAYFTHYRGAYNTSATGPIRTDIYAIDGAWIWYIPMSDDITSVGVVLDMEHPRHRDRVSSEALFDEFVARCPEVEERLRGAERVEKIRGVPDISYANRRFVGDGFVMVGDAATFVDPIFSSGVHLAMKSGEMAAQAIDRALAEGGATAERLAPYEARHRAQTGAIFGMIRNWYSLLENGDAGAAARSFDRVARMPLLRRQFLLLASGVYDPVERTPLMEAAAV